MDWYHKNNISCFGDKYVYLLVQKIYWQMSLAIRLYLSYNCSWCCVFFLVSVCFALFFCFLEIMLICVFLVVKAANMCTVSLLVRVDIWVCVCIGKYSRGRRTPRSSFVIITFVIHLFVFTPKGMKYKHAHTCCFKIQNKIRECELITFTPFHSFLVDDSIFSIRVWRHLWDIHIFFGSL